MTTSTPSGGGDAAEADVEAVGEEERVARREVGGDVLVVDRLLLGVGHQDHDDVGLGRGLGDRQHRRPGASALASDDEPSRRPTPHVDARVLEVEGVGVALRAVADDGDLAAADERPGRRPLVVHVGVIQPAFPFTARRRAWRSSLGSATRPVRWSSTMP